MLAAEMDNHLGYHPYERTDSDNARNVKKQKTIRSKYWLRVLNELKNRGVKDILILCADGLSGIKESINVAFPNTEYQRCIVHQVRNTLKYVADKDKKEFTAVILNLIYMIK